MARTPHTAPRKIRIIGGQWKRWQLPVADRPGLRPTPDRVRETLFSWLADALPGARCLDLFAGTGILGLEALSRGASVAWLVELDPAGVRDLRTQVERLQCTQVVIRQADVRHWLSQPAPQAFDIVFLDPPYHSGWLDECLQQLARPGWLAQGAWVYVELGSDEATPPLPAGWRIHRETRAGQVRACLCQAGD